MKPFVDHFENEFKIGDHIIYPCRSGSRLWIQYAKVVGFDDKKLKLKVIHLSCKNTPNPKTRIYHLSNYENATIVISEFGLKHYNFVDFRSSINDLVENGIRAFAEQSKILPSERFDRLVKLGIIDEHGKVVYDEEKKE